MREPPLMVRWAQRSPSEVDWCHYLLHSGPLKSRARSNGLIACVSDFGRPFCDWNPSSCWQNKIKNVTTKCSPTRSGVVFLFLFFRSARYKHVLQNIHFLTIHCHMSENSFLKQSEMTAHFSQVSFPKKQNCPCKHPGHASVSEQQRKYTATKNHPFNLGWEREKKNKLQETTSNLMIHSCNISISS